MSGEEKITGSLPRAEEQAQDREKWIKISKMLEPTSDRNDSMRSEVFRQGAEEEEAL